MLLLAIRASGSLYTLYVPVVDMVPSIIQSLFTTFFYSQTYNWDTGLSCLSLSSSPQRQTCYKTIT